MTDPRMMLGALGAVMAYSADGLHRTRHPGSKSHRDRAALAKKKAAKSARKRNRRK